MTKTFYSAIALAILFSFGPSIQVHSATVLDVMEEGIGGPPHAMVCGKTKGEVSKEELLNMKEIELRGCVETAKITGFKITVVRTNEDGSDTVIILSTKGDSLTEEMKSLINGIPLGSKVYFEDIVVVDATGKKYDIKPVVVTIG